MTSHSDRPLWRIGTKTLAQELRRRSDGEAVQRAFLSECDTALLLAEIAVRGYRVVNPIVTINGGEDSKPLPYPLDDELGGAQDGIPEANTRWCVVTTGADGKPFEGPWHEGYTLPPPTDAGAPILGKQWPKMADDDGPLPFEDDGDE